MGHAQKQELKSVVGIFLKNENPNEMDKERQTYLPGRLIRFALSVVAIVPKMKKIGTDGSIETSFLHRHRPYIDATFVRFYNHLR